MPGKASFSRPGTEASGDRAQGNTKRGTLTLSGNVNVNDSGSAPEVGDQAYGGNGPANLSCNTLDVDAKSKIYTADGNVRFSQGSRTGAAEHGTLDRGSSKLRLERNVKLTDGESTMTANTVDYNLTTKDVVVHGGPIIIKQPVPSAEPRPASSASPKPKSAGFRSKHGEGPSAASMMGLFDSGEGGGGRAARCASRSRRGCGRARSTSSSARSRWSGRGARCGGRSSPTGCPR